MQIKELPSDIRRLAFEEAKLQKIKITLESDINYLNTFDWFKCKYNFRFWQLCEQGRFQEARFLINLNYSMTKEIILLIKHLLR
jgi:hypothetical protein